MNFHLNMLQEGQTVFQFQTIIREGSTADCSLPQKLSLKWHDPPEHFSGYLTWLTVIYTNISCFLFY